MLNKTVVRGDNTGHFGGGLFLINARFPEGMSVSKMDVQIGSRITKQYANPRFPILVNLTGEESLKLDFSSKVSVALWDNYGRKGTAPQTYELKSIAQLVNAPDAPYSNNPNINPSGEIPTFEFSFDKNSPIQAEFILEIKPFATSALVNDSGFITNGVDDLINYTKTTEMNALLDLKANQTDLDQTNATVSNLSTTVTENYNILNNKIDTVNQELTGDIEELDGSVVHLTGNETIEGDKTFQANIIIGLDGAITCHQGYNLINEKDNKVIVGNGREALNITSFGRATANNNPIATDNTVASDIAEHNADETAHPFIQNLVTLEVTDRENAVNDLQEQIDAIVASSDVKDYVNTHAELLQYDTSTLGNRDIIVVLSDETHNNATSYYRWIVADNAFTYIGSIGPFATPGEVAESYVPKTRQINGKALSADISLDAEDVGALPSSTVIPTVNNGKLTIRVNDETEAEFTANQSTNTLLNIDVPTQVSELVNDANYVQNTNYATTSTGGVIKTALTAGNSVDNNGVLQGVIRTQQQYNTDANVMMISKGTLENIKETIVASVADNRYESKLDVQLLEGAVI